MTPGALRTRPRPVLSFVDHEHRDLAVADAACGGRYTHLGVTLPLGLPPDWHAGLPGDEEWRIEWRKLPEGLDLAHAGAVTGDPRYAATWTTLVESFCDQVAVGADASDVSARRVQHWLFAWQRFVATDEAWLDEPFAARLARRVGDDADHLAAHLTGERNHRTLELSTLLLVGLALEPDLVRAREALDLIAENARTDIWDDGVQRECATDYHLIVLRSLVGAIANARAAGLAVPSELVDRTHRACDFALHVQRPDGTTPALSDGDVGDFRPFLARAGVLLGRPDLVWAATGGRAGEAPERRNVTFPLGGYCVQRSGWGDGPRRYDEERWGIVDCGPLGDGGHGHYDHLSVELFAGARRLVVDPGRYTYADDAAGWRRWFKGTAAHNTVTVDGMDQMPYHRGKPRGETSSARLVARASAPGLDVVVGAVTSPCYAARHRRVVAFVADDYWIVHDELRAGKPHRYATRWHLSAGAWGATSVERSSDVTRVAAPGFLLVVPAWCGDVALEDGWVSPRYGIKDPAPVIVVTTTGADADIVTVVAPGADLGDVHVAGAPSGEGAGGWRARTTWPGHHDDVRWCVGPDPRASWERTPC